VDYANGTSIMHCRHVVTFLLHAATNVCLSVGSSEENGVGKDLINTQQSSRVRTTMNDEGTLSATFDRCSLVICESNYDLQFALSDSLIITMQTVFKIQLMGE